MNLHLKYKVQILYVFFFLFNSSLLREIPTCLGTALDSQPFILVSWAGGKKKDNLMKTLVSPSFPLCRPSWIPEVDLLALRETRQERTEWLRVKVEWACCVGSVFFP